MKKIKKIVCLVIAFALIMSQTALAEMLTWENVPGHHNQSVLLENGELSSKDIVQRYARGEILSAGMTEIRNEQNGTIHINVDTYAHTNVDKISHTVFLDQWDESKEDWKQVGYWEFEKSKDETTDGKLSSLITGFTVSGYAVNKYYRVRGLHLVELGDDVEGCASETHGVLITKN